jgi:ParB family chromosome partitioning protein
MNKRKSLGRGLDALHGGAAAGRAPPASRATPPADADAARRADAPAAAAMASPEAGADARSGLRELPVDLLQRGRYQPRIDMREETLAELAESIRRQGIVQPIVVRPVGLASGGEQRYEIVAGERRWRAAQLAGLHTIPALIKDIPDEAAVAVALIENIQRENLNPLEEARSLERLVDEFGLTHAEAAEAVGRSRAAVSNLLRLLELPKAVCELVEQRVLDMGHARALLGLASSDERLELARRIAKDGLSVRETEAAVRRLAGAGGGGGGGGGGGAKSAKGGGKPADPNVQQLETELADTLGAAVSIEHGPKGGRVVIRYHGLDELEGILAHIK